MAGNQNRSESSGLVIIYTGKGKGKTTAALGLALRAAGHGNKIKIIQFLKSDWEYGELKGLKRLEPDIEIETIGVGCIGIMGDDKPIEEHRVAAQKGLKRAAEIIRSDKYDTVILDEINIGPTFGLFDVEDIIELINDKPKEMNLVLTGRNADERLYELADLVTEMKEVKHPFQKGILAKKGIDF